MNMKPGIRQKMLTAGSVQFICLDEENVMPGMMTVIATDVQESHSRNEQLMNSLKEAYQSARRGKQGKKHFSQQYVP